MNVTFKLREGVLWATVSGSVSLVESVKTFQQACDEAIGEGSMQVLIDYSAVRGELYPVERYELGRASAEYFLCRSPDFKLAIVGHPPVIDGFVALIAVNRILTSAIFHEIEPAVEW